MNWTPDQRALLFRLAEDGALSAAELARAAALAELAPAPAEWRHALDRLLAFGGVLLVAAAVVFFFAYNWDAMHRFTKFGLAIAALGGACGAALLAAPFGTLHRAALFGACVATGALLALIGQTYQTGADVWELFAAWAALMSPFALLSRSSASWALCVVVANAALMRSLSQSVWWGLVDSLFHVRSLLAIAGFNLVVLLVFEGFERRLIAHPGRWLQRLAAVGVVGPLCVGAVLGWWERDFLPALWIFAIGAAVGGVVYRRRRCDLAILALIVYAAIAVLAAGLMRALRVDNFLTINMVGLFIIGVSAWAGLWLTGVHRQSGAEGRQP